MVCGAAFTFTVTDTILAGSDFLGLDVDITGSFSEIG
jgi:hypothetical protein